MKISIIISCVQQYPPVHKIVTLFQIMSQSHNFDRFFMTRNYSLDNY